MKKSAQIAGLEFFEKAINLGMDNEQIIDDTHQSAGTDKPLILLHMFGKKLSFDRERVTLGRADDCDIAVPYPCASPTHIIFSRGEEGWIIMDAGSVNGTWLNNKRLTPHISYTLHDTDIIAIPTTEEVDYNIQIDKADTGKAYLIDDVDIKPAPVSDAQSGLSHFLDNYERPPVPKAPDGTVILKKPDMLWNDQFIFLASVPEIRQPETVQPFLKYNEDGNLYSDIPSPEYLHEHKCKQCKHCGAFAETYETVCPNCRQALPDERILYADPVIYTACYQAVTEEIDDILKRMFPRRGLGMCFGIWHMKQEILRERHHILWRTPGEMNPHVRFE